MHRCKIRVTPCRLLEGRPLRPLRPQATYLSLITFGDHCALATKGPLCLEVELA